jgi:hypothetical protein
MSTVMLGMSNFGMSLDSINSKSSFVKTLLKKSLNASAFAWSSVISYPHPSLLVSSQSVSSLTWCTPKTFFDFLYRHLPFSLRGFSPLSLLTFWPYFLPF